MNDQHVQLAVALVIAAAGITAQVISQINSMDKIGGLLQACSPRHAK